MSIPLDRRTRKRLATRQAISDAATRLFFERGYDQVTVGDIAAAADVGRMTVFNHFPRKEDMFFDLDDDGREELKIALRQRAPGVTPVKALRLLAHRVVEERRPYIRFFDGSERFLETIQGSEALIARARALRDELANLVQIGLSASVGRDASDADAQLAAHLFVATCTAAYLQSHRIYRRDKDSEEAQKTFLAIADQGLDGVEKAMADTPYV